jgi:hypothetical protein
MTMWSEADEHDFQNKLKDKKPLKIDYVLRKAEVLAEILRYPIFKVGARIDSNMASILNDCVQVLRTIPAMEAEIEEIIEPAQEPVKKPIKWAKEAHAWIDGIEVEWQDCLDGSWVKATLMNPITDPHLNWRIKPQEVPQWRKDLAEKMKAGGVLEFRITQDSYWMPASADINDVLDAECGMHESQYRIKPEPKPDVVEFYVKFPHDALVLHGADFEWISENGKKCPQLKVIWDSEGNLKDAEVLK